MRYDDLKNRLLTYLTDDTQKARIERAFSEIEALAPTVSSVREQLVNKVNSIDSQLDLIDEGKIPVNAIPKKLEGLISMLERLSTNTRAADREIYQEVERIKLLALSVIMKQIDNAKGYFSLNKSLEASVHNKGVQTALATEMLLKDIYSIINLDNIILDKFNDLSGKNETYIKNMLPVYIDKVWKEITKKFTPSEASVLESEIKTVKDLEGAELKFNGHNTFALINTLPERVQNLIKYQILVRRVKDIDANIELPSFDEFLSVHDYVMLLKDFDTVTYEDLFNALKKNMILYSSDFDQKRYLYNKISEDNYKFNLAYFSASYMVLLHEYEDLDKYTCITVNELDEEKYKKPNILIVPKEYEKIHLLYSKSLDDLIKSDVSKKELLDKIINKDYFEWINSLNKYNFYTLISKFNENEIDWLYEENKTNRNNFEDTLYYLIYLKSYLKGLDLDLTDKNLERVSKFINLVNTTNDFSKLEFQYNNWLGTIRIEDFTPEELDILEKFDPNYINGISNYSLKSYHYLCKKVNADFSSDVSLVGTDEARRKAEFYEFLYELEIKELPDYMNNIDYRIAASLIDTMEDYGIKFEDIPEYFFIKDYTSFYYVSLVVNDMISKNIDPRLLPKELLPKNLAEASNLNDLFKIIEKYNIDFEKLISIKRYLQDGVIDLVNYLNFFYSSNFNMDLFDVPLQVFGDNRSKEVCALTYHYKIYFNELPHYYDEYSPVILRELMNVFNECGYSVTNIPHMYFHFYKDNLPDILRSIHASKKNITKLDLNYFSFDSNFSNSVSSYFTYLSLLHDRYIDDELSEFANNFYIEHKNNFFKEEISTWFIEIVMIHFILNGKNPKTIKVNDVSYIFTYFKANLLLSFDSVAKYDNHFAKVTNKKYDKLSYKRVPFNESGMWSTDYLLNGMLKTLGVPDEKIKMFATEIYPDMTVSDRQSLLFVLRKFLDLGINSNRIPDYLLGLYGQVNFQHLERIVNVFYDNNIMINSIPYYYLFDPSGEGNNSVYNENVMVTIGVFESHSLDFSDIPYHFIGVNYGKINSLLFLSKRYKVNYKNLPAYYMDVGYTDTLANLLDYFIDKGYTLLTIPERFIRNIVGNNVLSIIKLFEENGLSIDDIEERHLKSTPYNIDEIFDAGLDIKDVPNNYLKYGVNGAKYLDIVNNIEIEEGMLYLSQFDIVETFNSLVRFNSKHKIEELLNSKSIIYMKPDDVDKVLACCMACNTTFDLRMFYFPFDFFINYYPYLIEYLKQSGEEIVYEDVAKIAGKIQQRVGFIPEDRIDMDPNSPTYTPKIVAQDVITPPVYKPSKKRR